MTTLPTLTTERLILRPFALSDAPAVQALAGAREIADTTLNVPHPYPDEAAEAWIATHAENVAAGRQYPFAVVRREDNLLIGAMGLRVDERHHRAELGYWIGVPYWGQGYATEAARRVIRFGFADLGLNRIYATYLTRNPASGRVMQKAGMQFEGIQRQAVRKWEADEDLGQYAILRSDLWSEG